MPEYRIRILTSADISGLEQTKQAQDAVSRSAQDMTTRMSAATQAYRDAQNPVAAATSSSQKFGNALADTERKTGGLVAGLKKVGNAIPGFQFALASLTNIWALLAAAIVGVISKMRQWDEIVQKNEARIKAWRDLNKEVDRFRGNLEEAKAEWIDFNREFEKAAKEEKTPSEEGEEAAAKAKAGFGAQRARIQEGANLQLAKIEAAEAAGSITPAQAEQQRRRLGLGTTRQLEAVDLAEKKELSDIKLLAASAERARGEQLRQQLPSAQEAVIAAKNRRDDASRAVRAAMRDAGFDDDLNAMPGGRAAEIEAELAGLDPRRPGPFRTRSDVLRRREALQGEMGTLRGAVIQARDLLGRSELGVSEAEARFSDIRSGGLRAAAAGTALRRQGLSEAGELSGASQLAGELGGMRANAASLRESAELQKESARQLREVIRTLGEGISEIGGLKRQVEHLRSQSKGHIASE